MVENARHRTRFSAAASRRPRQAGRWATLALTSLFPAAPRELAQGLLRESVVAAVLTAEDRRVFRPGDVPAGYRRNERKDLRKKQPPCHHRPSPARGGPPSFHGRRSIDPPHLLSLRPAAGPRGQEGPRAIAPPDGQPAVCARRGGRGARELELSTWPSTTSRSRSRPPAGRADHR